MSALTDPRRIGSRKRKLLGGERLECASDERFEPRFGPLHSVVPGRATRLGHPLRRRADLTRAPKALLDGLVKDAASLFGFVMADEVVLRRGLQLRQRALR